MNCPERRNALSEAHMRELIAVFGAAELTLTLRRLPQPVVAKVQASPPPPAAADIFGAVFVFSDKSPDTTNPGVRRMSDRDFG
jgi:hypothetical protein